MTVPRTQRAPTRRLAGISPMTLPGPLARDWTGFAEHMLTCLPSSTLDRLKRYLSCLLPLTQMRVPVVWLRGASRTIGRPATMLAAGTEPWVSYLAARFFAGTPQREALDRVSIWRLPRLLRTLRPAADLTVVRVDRLSARLLFDDDYLTVPEWVGTRLLMPVDLALLAKRSNSVADDIRRTRRDWPQCDISGPEAFDDFYRRMYLPYIRMRHGPRTHVRSASSLRQAVRHGGILWVCDAGKRVAGGVFERNGGKLDWVAIGVADGNVEWLKKGAVAALYFHLIDYARQHGCTQIDLRGSRPSLADGLLRYKRKWGAVLYERRDVFWSTLVHWNRLDGAVVQFLSHTPLIFRHGDALSAVATVERQMPWTTADLQQAHDQLWIAGLRRLCLVTGAELPATLPRPQGTWPIALKTLSDAGPRALLRCIDQSVAH